MLPILYQSPEFILYSYPLLMGLGWGVAHQVFFSLEKEMSKFYENVLFWGMFLTSWIGAKIFFLLTANYNLPSDLISQVSFWTGGGFVFYGGLIGAVVFLFIYRLMKFPLTVHSLWAMLPALTLGHAIGRIGCFLAGCCYGSETNCWWGIEMHGSHRHPTQLIESLGLFVLAWYLRKVKVSLQALATYFMSYGVLRFSVECLRGDLIRGQWGAFTPSQWFSIVLVLTGLLLHLYKNKISHLLRSQSE